MSDSLYDIDLLEPLIARGCTLITPNQRLARRIRTEWDKRQAGQGILTWPRLPVYPLASWLLDRWRQAVAGGELPPQLLLEAGPVLQVWRNVIKDSAARTSSYHLLRTDDAAELAEQARQNLCLWRIKWQRSALREEFEQETDSRIYWSWLEAFEQTLRDSGQATATDCVEALLTLKKKAREGVAPVVLVECGELAPLHRAALERICPSIESAPVPTRSAERLLHVFQDRREELQAVSRWAVQRVRQEPQHTIGIVTGESASEQVGLEYLLRREFGCLGDNYDALPVNFSSGIPLSQVPLVRDALAVLSMALRRTNVDQVNRLLKSRFLDLPDADSALAQLFLSRLYDLGREQLDVSELRYYACETSLAEQRGLQLGKYLLDLYRMAELKQPALPSVWMSRYRTILELWGWPGKGLDSLEYQQMDSWGRVLDAFRGFDAVCGPLSYPEALSLLRDTCLRTVSHPQTVDAGVQVLGPLEAAGLSFDHLWIIGVQASVWPAAARPNAFLPIRLQVRHDMPRATAEHEWEFARGRMAQYLRSCGTVHASYSCFVDGVADRASPLLQEFAEAPIEALPAVAVSWLETQQRGRLTFEDDSDAPPLDPMAVVRSGSSLLEAQSNCPFSAFARQRLSVTPLGTFGFGLSPADRGTLLHEALYVLWGELEDHEGLAALHAASQTAAISRAVEAAVQGGRRKMGSALNEAFWVLESERMSTLLQEWLAVERQRGAFKVAAREHSLELELDRLHLRLRVDRIDELPDGGRVIIDYKSSKSRTSDWMGERPARPQLLLYGVAEPKSAAALGFAQVRPGECRYVGLGRVEAAKGIKTDLGAAQKAGMLVESWEELNARWREILADLADDFLSGKAAVDPLSASTCTWCGLQPLCRVGHKESAPGEGA
ncbi:MAG: PD-(D/E)XK nuclease family protein [Halioglobus sp.]|nr:PD-(D/E)XK nuclease family protein [Halioglobus sp.]